VNVEFVEDTTWLFIFVANDLVDVVVLVLTFTLFKIKKPFVFMLGIMVCMMTINRSVRKIIDVV
jgi:hypothetical protein